MPVPEYLTELRYRRLDANGDMILGTVRAPMLDKLDAMVQLIRTRLLQFEEEWWESTDGLPLFTQILGRPRSEDTRLSAELAIINYISETVGVTAVYNAQSEYVPDRGFHFMCRVKTVYGDVEVNETL